MSKKGNVKTFYGLVKTYVKKSGNLVMLAEHLGEHQCTEPLCEAEMQVGAVVSRSANFVTKLVRVSSL